MSTKAPTKKMEEKKHCLTFCKVKMIATYTVIIERHFDCSQNYIIFGTFCNIDSLSAFFFGNLFTLF